MSDRFKFRFWDEEDKRMLSVNHIIGLKNPSEFAFCSVDCSERGQSGNLVIAVENPNHLMQSTGLKDKNGKLIFEGDILGGGLHATVTVKWDEKYACFTSYDVEEEGNTDGSLLGNDIQDCKEWEIIGNIYENPELLEVQS